MLLLERRVVDTNATFGILACRQRFHSRHPPTRWAVILCSFFCYFVFRFLLFCVQFFLFFRVPFFVISVPFFFCYSVFRFSSFCVPFFVFSCFVFFLIFVFRFFFVILCSIFLSFRVPFFVILCSICWRGRCPPALSPGDDDEGVPGDVPLQLPGRGCGQWQGPPRDQRPRGRPEGQGRMGRGWGIAVLRC